MEEFILMTAPRGAYGNILEVPGFNHDGAMRNRELAKCQSLMCVKVIGIDTQSVMSGRMGSSAATQGPPQVANMPITFTQGLATRVAGGPPREDRAIQVM